MDEAPAKPVRKPNLRKGEIFERFFAALPDYGVQAWSLIECERVRRALKPCWQNHDARGMLMNRLNERKQELRKKG